MNATTQLKTLWRASSTDSKHTKASCSPGYWSGSGGVSLLEQPSEAKREMEKALVEDEDARELFFRAKVLERANPGYLGSRFAQRGDAAE